VTRVVVTGAGGFTGQHACRVLRSLRIDVAEWVSPRVGGVDLRDTGQVEAAFRRDHPSAVLHLAGRARPKDLPGFEDLLGHNVQGTWALLEAVRRVAPEIPVIVVSSSAVYGRGPVTQDPIGEDECCAPVLPYGATKAAVEALAAVYTAVGLRVSVVRPFNLVGPGQGREFAVANLARQVVLIKRSPGTLVECGRLDSVRDFLDVRDAAEAYCSLLQLVLASPSSIGPLNLCSGVGRRLGDVLEELAEIAGVTRDELQVQPVSGGATDIPHQLGDSTRLRAATEWAPRYPWRQTLSDIVADWETRIGKERS